ncbi:MAG TPA: hypothetical protein PLC12_05745, partial [Candidatus Methanofastidiosa archaeon]|nr:hypothetical protein [Candidatus Methanofastidiosa archaeon]
HEYVDVMDYSSGSMTDFGWNGEYWLISGYVDHYMLATYDGESLDEIEGPWGSDDFDFESSEVSYSLLNLASTLEEYNFAYFSSGLKLLGWFGGHWLLVGAEWSAIFDGEEFTITSLHTPLTEMICLDTYCLVAGRTYPGQASYPILIRYDGTELVKLEDQMINAGVPYTLLDLSMGVDGNWYITTYESNYNEDYTSKIVTISLVKYDGTTFEKITDLPEKFYAYTVGYNGEYFLLANAKQLWKYEDGEFTDLTEGLGVTWDTTKSNNDIIWADGYWMVRMGDVLFKYDGDTLTELESDLTNVAWNGEYCLVGSGSELWKYDGETLTEIGPFGGGALMEWNGEYWLIDCDSALLKYDDDTITDLTDEYLALGQSFDYYDLYYIASALAIVMIAAFVYARGRR